MFTHYRTKGFILKKRNQGEANQLFTVFTKDFGRIEILGKSIRKITSKLRAGAEIFNLSEIEFIQGKTRKTLTDIAVIENFPDIRGDLGKLTLAYKISGIFDKLIKGENADKGVWDFLNNTFKKLNDYEFFQSETGRSANRRHKYLHRQTISYRLLYYYFFWNFLKILGYQPQLYKCSVCQKRLAPKNLYFSSKEGGAVCSLCSEKITEAKSINTETIKILRLILKKDETTLNRLKLNSSLSELLGDISEDYFTYIN